MQSTIRIGCLPAMQESDFSVGLYNHGFIISQNFGIVNTDSKYFLIYTYRTEKR